MSVKRSESNDPKKMKKLTDKSAASVSYRDYLDMDTDEEEFGRQETPEPDEELPVEPEKPVFTSEELKTLVEYVKKLSLLPNIKELILSDDCTHVIREYFCNPAHTVLTIYQSDSNCKALLDFPKDCNHSLTYFLRSSWQIYTVSNFMSTIIFGSINGSSMENSILKFFENIYAPIAFHSDQWPKVTKDLVFSHLNEFLISLTDATYQPMGLTILHIPREGLQLKVMEKSELNVTWMTSVDDVNAKNGLIERLERVMRYWTRQIREVLKEINILPRSICITIIEKIQLWNQKFENLNCLQHQLHSETVISIVETLKKAQSASVNEFHSLLTEVEKQLIEVTSNITYLNLFVNYCGDFEIPDEIDNYATKVLLLIKFVAIESKYYKSTNQIEALCKALGSQIILQCRKYIDLNEILEDDPKIGKIMLENSISCCEKFKKIFDEFIVMDGEANLIFSKIDRKNAFCHINTFIQRCRDLIEITNSRLLFVQSNERKMMCGPRAIEHELQYKKIENLFYESLNEIKTVCNCILDVTIFTWFEIILKFKHKIDDIDNMIIKLIHNIFRDILNVDEGLEALYVMRRFVTRPQLEKQLCIYWTRIWRLFESELQNVITCIDNNTVTLNKTMATCTEVVATLRMNNDYLTSQFNMLINASDWFGDSPGQEMTIDKYKRVQAVLLEKEKNIFSTWSQEIITGAAIGEILNRPVIKFYSYPNDVMITVNLDLSCLEQLHAINEWKNMKYETKIISNKNPYKWESLKIRYSQVDFLCKLYNNLIKQWTKEEHLLFKYLLDNVNNTMIAALPKKTWNCNSIDTFYDECLKNIIYLKDVTEFFNDVNQRIECFLETVTTALLIHGTCNKTYSLNEFQAYLNAVRNENLLVMKEASNSVAELVLQMKNKIQQTDVMPEYWRTYVESIVTSFERSFIENIQSSLQSALQFFHGDNLTKPEPFLIVELQYRDGKINLERRCREVKSMMEEMILFESEKIFQEFSTIYNLDECLKKVEFIETDETIIYLINRIKEELQLGLDALNNSIFTTDIPAKLSNIERVVDLFKQNDASKDRRRLEAEINRCEEITEAIITLSNSIRVNFIILETTAMKFELLNRCFYLKDQLVVELNKLIATEMAV